MNTHNQTFYITFLAICFFLHYHTTTVVSNVKVKLHDRQIQTTNDKTMAIYKFQGQGDMSLVAHWHGFIPNESGIGLGFRYLSHNEL